MTLQQEAYNRIDQMTEDGIRTLIKIIDVMRTVSITGFKEPMTESQVVNKAAGLTKEEKKRRFLQSAGKIKIDAAAVNDLRERSEFEQYRLIQDCLYQSDFDRLIASTEESDK